MLINKTKNTSKGIKYSEMWVGKNSGHSWEKRIGAEGDDREARWERKSERERERGYKISDRLTWY